ncbi:MAG: hypothetical protein ACRC7V_03430 [Lachnospiraceae bacterium]
MLQKIISGMDEDKVFELIRTNFRANGYRTDFSEIYDEALDLCKALKKQSIDIRAIEIAGQIREYGDYRYLKSFTKSRLFDFEIGDSSNNLKLYKAVMKELGIQKDLDEHFEDYQEIYDETLNQQCEQRSDKKWEKDIGR